MNCNLRVLYRKDGRQDIFNKFSVNIFDKLIQVSVEIIFAKRFVGLIRMVFFRRYKEVHQ